MLQVIYMKADYEPWYKFDGWEEHIVEKLTFEKEDEAKDYLNHKLADFRGLYAFEKCKEEKYWAFWNVQEQCFCDSCDEDLQIYHGLMWIDNR